MFAGFTADSFQFLIELGEKGRQFPLLLRVGSRRQRLGGGGYPPGDGGGLVVGVEHFLEQGMASENSRILLQIALRLCCVGGILSRYRAGFRRR